ncbi:astacin-like metalloendopeptidase [Mantella aurantiaca]
MAFILSLTDLSGPFGATSAFASTKQQEDVILQINQRQDSEDHSEYSDLFEGDILFPRASTAFSPNIVLWVKKAGIVQIPYILHPSYEPEHIQTINAAFSDFHATTCIRFVNRTDQRDYISIMPGLGCYSSIGRIGKRQIVSLSFGCLTKGKGPTLHELMHVLGFWHEHSRADRDKYITINWEAIRKGYTQNFCKYDTTNMIVNYTFGSILHYSETAFADSEGLKTIVPLTTAEIGQREKLHEMDILRVNKLYCTEPEEFSPGVRPEIYNCNAENTKQNAEIELHTTADSFANIRQESSFISASNFSAAQEPAYTPPFNSSAIQESEFSAASNSSNSERLEHSPASSSSTSQEPEYIQVPISFATQESEHSPTANSSSEGLKFSPNHNSSATRIPGFGTALGSFTTVASKAVSFNFSRLTSAMTGERKKDLIFKLVSTYAPGPEVTQNIYYTNSEIFGGKVSLWPATTKGVTQGTQMTTVQASSSITEASPIVSSLANTSLKEPTKVLASTSLKANQNVDSTLFFSQEGLEGTTITVQESGNASLILPTVETKSSETTILKTLGRPASKISAAPTKMIVPTQNTMEENPALEKNTSSYISQKIGMPEQSSNDYVWYPGNKAEVNLPHDQKYDHLRIRLLKMLGKGSLPDSRGTTVSFLKERRLKNKSALKSLRKIFYFGRPSAVTIKPVSFCGFEAGMCGWKQSTGDDLDWKLVWGSVNTYTGHIKEGGFHLSLESHQGKLISGQRAILVRPITQPFSCISLWYGYRHSIMGTLNIYVISNSGKKTLLWSVAGQEPLRWTKAQIELQPLFQYHNVQVVVEGIVDPIKASQIVLDNLYVGNCS